MKTQENLLYSFKNIKIFSLLRQIFRRLWKQLGNGSSTEIPLIWIAYGQKYEGLAIGAAPFWGNDSLPNGTGGQAFLFAGVRDTIISQQLVNNYPKLPEQFCAF